MIEVVEMGAEFSLMQLRAVEAIENADTVIVQSTRSGTAKEIAARARMLKSMDSLFETTDNFETLYARGASLVLESEGKVVFCCLGSVGENGFVNALRERTEVLFLGGGDPVREALTLVSDRINTACYTVIDARQIETAHLDTSRTLVVSGIDDIYQAQQAKLTLTEYYPAALEIALIQEGVLEWMPLGDIDRLSSWGSGGVLVLRPLSLLEKERFTYFDLLEVMKILRAPDGCPWDAEQTHRSLTPYLIEEAYEVQEAVLDEDLAALGDELGDVLLQVVFHAEIARLKGEFDEMDVTTAVTSKMIRRHPHVFGDVQADDAKTVLKNWDAIKRIEKGENTYTGALADIPSHLGGLLRALKLQKKAANIGFDWDGWRGAIEKVREETAELEDELEMANTDSAKREDEGGDLLFAVVNLLRLAGIDPEKALAAACRKFIRRFSYMEAHAGGDLRDLDLQQMDQLWEAAKNTENC